MKKDKKMQVYLTMETPDYTCKYIRVVRVDNHALLAKVYEDKDRELFRMLGNHYRILDETMEFEWGWYHFNNIKYWFKKYGKEIKFNDWECKVGEWNATTRNGNKKEKK